MQGMALQEREDGIDTRQIMSGLSQLVKVDILMGVRMSFGQQLFRQVSFGQRLLEQMRIRLSVRGLE